MVLHIYIYTRIGEVWAMAEDELDGTDVVTTALDSRGYGQFVPR
jgi:hypothetical protein